jgi:DNA-directed RNA polymerase subunit RPC12/RpoP
LWFCRWSADRSANSVVWGDGRVYASTNFPNEEIICVRADGNGDVTDSHVVWRQNRNAADVSAPLYHDGRLYLFSDKGIASCLDGATGNALWTMRLGPAFASSPVLAGDRIFVTDETGTTYVLQAGPEFKLLARNSINQQVLASPALSGDRLFLRTGRFLWCVDGQVDSRPANIVPPRANEFQPGSRPPVRQALAPPVRDSQSPLVGSVGKVKAKRDYGMILFAALLLLLLVSLGGLLIVVHVRRSSSVILDESCVIVEPEPESTPEVIAFTCSGCSKKLRGTAFMAGKKIKCPRCGTAVLVPGGSEHPDGYKKA